MSRRHIVLLLPGLILVAAMGLKTAVTSNSSNLIAAAPVMKTVRKSSARPSVAGPGSVEAFGRPPFTAEPNWRGR